MNTIPSKYSFGFFNRKNSKEKSSTYYQQQSFHKSKSVKSNKD